MDPGSVPGLCSLLYDMSNYEYYMSVDFYVLCMYVFILTQVEEMQISGVLAIMSVYRLHVPHGQYGYCGHVINLPQDVASFATTLPRLPVNWMSSW